jgi:hypothetical protein
MASSKGAPSSRKKKTSPGGKTHKHGKKSSRSGTIGIGSPMEARTYAKPLEDQHVKMRKVIERELEAKHAAKREAELAQLMSELNE